MVLTNDAGIVHDAHYPAYKLAGFDVVGAFDTNGERAKMMQEKFGIPVLYSSVEDLVERAPKDAIIDIALHGDRVLDLLKQLPDGRAVLIQKPLGEDLEASRAIRDLCRSKVSHFSSSPVERIMLPGSACMRRS